MQADRMCRPGRVWRSSGKTNVTALTFLGCRRGIVAAPRGFGEVPGIALTSRQLQNHYTGEA